MRRGKHSEETRRARELHKQAKLIEKQQQEELAQIELNRQFELARQKLRTFGSLAEAHRAMGDILSATTLGHMYEDKPLPKMDNQNKRRLVWYFNGARTSFLYENLAQQVSQRPADTQHILDECLGTYWYFRYMATNEVSQLDYIRGKITIDSDNGVPVFKHWSHDHSEEHPEHTGFVFLSDGNLFFAGRRQNTFRLAICKLFDDKRRGYMHGLVLSLRRRNQRDPFSARFIMVHDSNQTLIKKLANEDKLSEEDKKTFETGRRRVLQQSYEPTYGEEEFFRCASDARYAYFMLT